MACATPSREGVGALAGVEGIVAAGARRSLTKSVLAEWAANGTPRRKEYLLGHLIEEGTGRDASKRARPPGRCALPQAKTPDGHGWSAVSWPDGFGRLDLEAPSFVEPREDPVPVGGVGTGKAHMACAPCAMCCARGRGRGSSPRRLRCCA